jgi:hypothetical protein
MRSEQAILFSAMIKMYRRVFVDSISRCLKHWQFLILHLSYFLVVSLCSGVASSVGGLAGGFFLGMFIAVILGSYFLTISLAVQDEKTSLKEVAQRSFELFGPVINVLFALFIFKIIGQFVFVSPQTQWLEKVMNLLITILLNPVPEMVYQRPSGLLEMCADSFEFIKENSVEWFLPLFVLLLPLFFLLPFSLRDSLIFFTTTNAFDLLEIMFLNFADLRLLASYAPYYLGFLFFTYFLFVFRGLLFQELSSSSRRRRIYQARMEESD